MKRNHRDETGEGRGMGEVHLLSSADLPEEIRGYLRAVMDNSGLRGGARLDVLRELIAHFEDGRAAGRSSEELLAAFGDGSMAGRLIAHARRKDVRPVGRLWQIRDKWGEALVAFVRDLRLVLRGLRRNPTFTIVAILTLALGLGANTAVFSVVNGVVLRPLPYSEPDRLLAMFMTDEEDRDFEVPWSVHSLQDVVEANSSFSSITGWQWLDVTLTGVGDPEIVFAVGVTEGMLTTLGERPLLGRDIRSEEAVEGGPTVVVLSHRFWQEKMGEDPEVLGTTISLSGRAYEVVGVAPEGLAYPRSAAMWIPGQWSEETHPRGRHFLTTLGRLAPGVTMESAQAELSGIASHMEEENPQTNRARGIHLVSLKDETVGDVRRALFVLLGAVGMVLLIACANVANLLLVRGAARVREVAVRATLGAGRGAILRQIMVESVVLSFLGGGLGVLLAVWGVSGIKALSPGGIPRFGEVAVDGTVLVFALGLAVAVALLFGLIPAHRLANTSIATVIREGREERLATGDRRFARSALLTAEVALSLVLLLGAGLLLRSFAQIRGVELGFDPADVRQFTVTLPEARYERDMWPDFFREMEERIATVPGVDAVGMIYGSPLGRSHTSIGFNIVGRPQEGDAPEDDWLVRVVSPGYFESLRIPLLRGRGFEAADRADGQRVAVISRTAAERIFPGEDPIGQQFRFDVDDPPWAIVGIVGDVRSLDLTVGDYPEAYFPHAQWPRNTMTVTVRRVAGASGLLPALRREVNAMDPNLALYYVEMLEDRIARYTTSDRFYLVLLGLFASLAVILAAVGLYGVVAYLVSRRTREIGIRVALGAPRDHVVRLVLGQGVGPVFLGAVLGLAGALAGGRVLSSLLYQVEPWDPLTFVGGTLLLLLVAFAATLLPARWATKIPPTEAMRVE